MTRARALASHGLSATWYATLIAMQLDAIVLYSHDGRQRTLTFERGRLNVISGLSRTGKSELLKIIDFCAGRRTPELAPGPISNKVSWFAALFVAADGRRVFAARPRPSGRSTSTAMLEFGSELELPVDAGQISGNADAGQVRGALDDLLGLGRFDIEQYTGVRDRLRASVSHAIQFCLQSQNELMSPEHLFHRGGDADVAADFRELFPYFVGAIDEELLAARRRAAQLRRQLTSAERQLEIASARAQADRDRDRALVRQAIDVGLLEDEHSDQDARQVLQDLLVRGAPATATGGLAAAEEPLADLRAELSRSRTLLRELRERRAALGQLDRDRADHTDALHTQVGRLGLLTGLDGGDEDSAHCPACGAQLGDDDPALRDLARDAAQLERQLRALGSAARDIGPAERELDEAIENAAERHSEARRRLDEAQASDAAARALASAGEVRARLLGVIEEYLRAAQDTGAVTRAELAERVRQLGEELEAIEPGTGTQSVNEELEARLGAMSVNMTNWARELELEAADEGNVYIDRRTLNVAIGTPRGRIGLQRMGSGANHVGYHLVAHLALHEHFVRTDRPVPRFIVFDQPSLPFFPQGAVDRDQAAEDVDWQAVRAMMRLTDRVVAELAGALQVLMCDHASFAGEDWYDRALVEDWHTGTKLVPVDWPDG